MSQHHDAELCHFCIVQKLQVLHHTRGSMTKSPAKDAQNAAPATAGAGPALSALRGPATGGNASNNAAGNPPQTMAHGYDRHQLSPKEFLLAVMHAPNLPLATRMDAAVKLLRIVYIDGDYVPGEWCNKEPSLPLKSVGSVSNDSFSRHEASRTRGGDYGKSQSKERIGEDSSRPLRTTPGPYKLRDDI